MIGTESISGISTQAFIDDVRNQGVHIYVNGQFFPRHLASVSIFDSGFIAGDGVWEGLRLVNGKLVAIKDHMQRLFAGARSIDLDIGLSPSDVEQLIRMTLRKNDMHDGVHVRLMITRGVKSSPNQDPRFVVAGPTIVIAAEYKVPNAEIKARGISLFTSTFRCSTPDVFDLRLNSHSRLNLIQALIQALKAGADEALMLDPDGFVASCNSTNFFIVRNGVLCTSSGRYNFNGITQQTILRLASASGMSVYVGDFTLAEAYSAEEAFVTGTMGGITPVAWIDGRRIGTSVPGTITNKLSALYQEFLQGIGEE